MSSTPLPQCFFCGCNFDSHRENAKGHVWRCGPSVEPADFMLADEVTKALHRDYYRGQWNFRGIKEPESK